MNMFNSLVVYENKYVVNLSNNFLVSFQEINNLILILFNFVYKFKMLSLNYKFYIVSFCYIFQSNFFMLFLLQFFEYFQSILIFKEKNSVKIFKKNFFQKLQEFCEVLCLEIGFRYEDL